MQEHNQTRFSAFPEWIVLGTVIILVAFFAINALFGAGDHVQVQLADPIVEYVDADPQEQIQVELDAVIKHYGIHGTDCFVIGVNHIDRNGRSVPLSDESVLRVADGQACLHGHLTRWFHQDGGYVVTIPFSIEGAQPDDALRAQVREDLRNGYADWAQEWSSWIKDLDPSAQFALVFDPISSTGGA